ncbi:MAG: HEAT repeat domain-containing protein [Terracidiphilus sp.]
MPFKCRLGLHAWDGCKCPRCGNIRDEDHDWGKDCEECSKCGGTRSGGHDWSKNCERCGSCGRARASAHSWDSKNLACARCGANAHVPALGDRAPGVRRHAVESCLKLGETAIPVLIEALTDKSNDSRFGVMSALGRMGDKAVEPLIRALRDSGRRGLAAQLLGRLGDPRAAEPLVQATSSLLSQSEFAEDATVALAEIGCLDLVLRSFDKSNDSKTEHLVKALRRWGDPRAADAIVKRLEGGPSVGLLMQGSRALAEFRDARAGVFVDRLLSKTNYAVLEFAASTLALLEGADAVERLIGLLHYCVQVQTIGSFGILSGAGPSDSLYLGACVVAAEFLGRQPDPRAVQELIGLLECPWQMGRGRELATEFAARALGNIGSPEAAERLFKIASSSGWYSRKARLSAAMALDGCGDPRGRELLLADASKDWQAAAALVELGDARGKELLESFTEDKSPELGLMLASLGNRRGFETLLTEFQSEAKGREPWSVHWVTEAARILASSREDRAVTVLIEALLACSREVRPAILTALGQSGDPRVLPPLLAEIESSDPELRSCAALALGSLGEPAVLDALFWALDDVDGRVRAAAATSLARTGEAAALAPLVRLLSEKNRLVRLAATEALGALGFAAAVSPLEEQTRDADPAIRLCATVALAKLSRPA